MAYDWYTERGLDKDEWERAHRYDLPLTILLISLILAAIIL
jgi:hypothetical protein